MANDSLNNPRRRQFLKSAGSLGVASTAVAGCTSMPGSSGGGGNEKVTIGGIFPLSGPFAPWGASLSAGAKFAVNEINQSDEFNREIELLSRDSAADPSKAASIFSDYRSENVSAVMGVCIGDVILRLKGLTEEAQIPQFISTPGQSQTMPEGTRYTFRMNQGSIKMVMPAFEEIIQEKGLSSVAAITADYSWGHAFKRAIDDVLAANPEIETKTLVAPTNESDFSSYIRKFQDLDPEVMLTGGHPAGAVNIAKTQFELGLDPQITFGVSLHANIWQQSLGDQVYNGIVEWLPHNPTSQGYIDFAKRFYESNEKFVDQYVSIGYNTTKQIAEAAKRANSSNAQDIADTVRNTGYDTFLSYPLEHAKWGELNPGRTVFCEFKQGSPPEGVNPGANWHLAEYATSSKLQAPQPPKPQ